MSTIPEKLRRESAETQAERIIGDELERLVWKEVELGGRLKSDPAKFAMAGRLRREMTLPIKWIAARLHNGTWSSTKSKLHYWMQVHDKTAITQAKAMLEHLSARRSGQKLLVARLGEPPHCIVLALVDHLARLGHLDHPRLREGAPEEVLNQALNPFAVAGLQPCALVHAEAGVFPRTDVLDDVCGNLALGQEQREHLLFPDGQPEFGITALLVSTFRNEDE